MDDMFTYAKETNLSSTGSVNGDLLSLNFTTFLCSGVAPVAHYNLPSSNSAIKWTENAVFTDYGTVL